MNDPSIPPFFTVGWMGRPHGTRGELFVSPLTDRVESVYRPGRELHVSRSDEDLPDLDFPSLEIEAVRPYRSGVLVMFRGLETRTEAEVLRNRYLLLPGGESEPLAEGELFFHQVVGLRVRTADGVEVGEVVELYERHPADLLEVRRVQGSVLIPFTRQVVVSWDLEEGVLLIDPPDGLLDL